MIPHHNPQHAYQVNFIEFIPQTDVVSDANLSQRVRRAVESIFHIIEVVFYSTLNSGCLTLRYSGRVAN